MDPNSNVPPKITFEDDGWQQPMRPGAGQNPKIIQWVIDYSGGRVKNKQQAVYVLVGIIGLCVVIAFFTISNSGQKHFDSDVYPEGYLNDPNYESTYGTQLR